MHFRSFTRAAIHFRCSSKWFRSLWVKPIEPRAHLRWQRRVEKRQTSGVAIRGPFLLLPTTTMRCAPYMTRPQLQIKPGVLSHYNSLRIVSLCLWTSLMPATTPVRGDGLLIQFSFLQIGLSAFWSVSTEHRRLVEEKGEVDALWGHEERFLLLTAISEPWSELKWSIWREVHLAWSPVCLLAFHLLVTEEWLPS